MNTLNDIDPKKHFDYSFIEEAPKNIEGFKIGNKFFEYISARKGWGIIVKIIVEGDAPKQTVHLLFGCGENGTIGAVNYFINNYNYIYKFNKANEYFGIFEVDASGAKVGKISWLYTKDFFN